MFRILSTHGQGALLPTMLGVVAVLFSLVVVAIMSSKAKEGVNSADADVNATFDNLTDGTKDASDLGQVLMLFVILAALFSIGIYGMFRMR